MRHANSGYHDLCFLCLVYIHKMPAEPSPVVTLNDLWTLDGGAMVGTAQSGSVLTYASQPALPYRQPP